MTCQRLIGPALVMLSLIYLFTLVPRGWVPHDEGMTGQSAEMILAGRVPHVDYEEPYTGGLAWLHAAVLRLAGPDLLHLRWLLFLGAAVAQILIYAMLRRYVSALGAAVASCVALGWSFANYFAAIPSWWVLIFGLACAWAFVRYVETGLSRYAAAAGFAAGMSVLAKQTGIYLVVGLAMALLYGEDLSDRRPSGLSPARLVCIAAGMIGVGFALAILRPRLALAELLYLLLPIAACGRVLMTRDAAGPESAPYRVLGASAVAMACAGVPITLFALPYLASGQGAMLLNGLFILPQKRLQFASMQMPSAMFLLAGLPFLMLVMPLPRRIRPGIAGTAAPFDAAAAAVWLLAALLLVGSLYDPALYQVVWQSTRAFAALLPVAACWILISVGIANAKQRWMLFGLCSLLAWASLIQFPFSAPIYFCYVAPLAVVAAAATAAGTTSLRRPAVTAWTGLLLAFAILSMNRGFIYNLGQNHEPQALNAPLDLSRAHLRTDAAEAVTYKRVVDLIRLHLGEARLVAGPDCPELYFLSGQVNTSGVLFDFFSAGAPKEVGLTDIAHWRNAGVVVLNHGPSFSPGPAPDLVAEMRKLFPQTAAAGRFEVRWR